MERSWKEYVSIHVIYLKHYKSSTLQFKTTNPYLPTNLWSLLAKNKSNLNLIMPLFLTKLHYIYNKYCFVDKLQNRIKSRLWVTPQDKPTISATNKLQATTKDGGGAYRLKHFTMYAFGSWFKPLKSWKYTYRNI